MPKSPLSHLRIKNFNLTPTHACVPTSHALIIKRNWNQLEKRKVHVNDWLSLGAHAFSEFSYFSGEKSLQMRSYSFMFPCSCEMELFRTSLEHLQILTDP